jgi:thiol-disulfide isomerase/thioredoxin
MHCPPPDDHPGVIRISRRTTLLTMMAGARAMFAINTREPAPRFTAKTLAGRTFTNDSLKGSVALIQFWTTWCGYCRRDQEPVDAITQDLASKGLVVLAVNVGESRRKVQRYLEQSPRSCHVVLTEDTNLAAVFAAPSFPFYVLIDSNGRIASTQRGAGGEGMLRKLLEKADLTQADLSRPGMILAHRTL